MTSTVDTSVIKLWEAFTKTHPKYKTEIRPESWYFCDNKKDADYCANLVIEGTKRATATSLWWFKKNNEPLPKKGNLYIVTDWDGKAKAIIETTQIDLVPYNEVTEAFAATEGEGDKSLAYWKRVHWDYYSREMKPEGESPTQDMLIACEQFKVIWK
jgi:uncharacterized protein YhfF